ncbi:hypothetical protein [Hymenobacter sp. HDW8]|uniref:hypothetical protein n=1 Tax=Hymenobacter sp. HDW8 TaxID=2714932 RepID=UPI00140BD790|nr:hypothetical protein [Hymenobacter sp. HDW8]QIL78359.1 hypothetical protein G7064_21325 [Hymenobacter sp. HDW8]
MRPFDTAKDVVLRILEDDPTELWFLVAEIHKLYPHASLTELQAVTQHVVLDRMAEHPIHLFDPSTELPLPHCADRVSELIAALFSRLNRLPDMGDGIWLGIAAPSPRSEQIEG